MRYKELETLIPLITDYCDDVAMKHVYIFVDGIGSGGGARHRLHELHV